MSNPADWVGFYASQRTAKGGQMYTADQIAVYSYLSALKARAYQAQRAARGRPYWVSGSSGHGFTRSSSHRTSSGGGKGGGSLKGAQRGSGSPRYEY